MKTLVTKLEDHEEDEEEEEGLTKNISEHDMLAVWCRNEPKSGIGRRGREERRSVKLQGENGDTSKIFF